MRKLAIIFGVFFSSSAFAQSSGIPWKNGRVLTAPMLQSLDESKLNVDSLGKPGFAPRLNSNGQITNPVVGDVSQAKATADGQTVVQVTAKAANAVQKTDVNTANGVAGLDGSGSVTSGIVTPKLWAGKLTGTDSSDPRSYKITFFNQLGDIPTSPDTVVCGGHQNPDNCYFKITGKTTGHGDTGGSVVSIYNNGRLFNQNRNGAGSTDGINLFLGTNDSAPNFEIGQDFTSSDGKTYTVYGYGTSYVQVTPQISAAARSYFTPKTRIYTNYKTGNNVGSGLHPFVFPALYFSYFKSFTDTTVNGTPVTQINVQYDTDNAQDGWSYEGPSGQVHVSGYPGSSAGDILDDTSNTALTDNATKGIDFGYTHPALFIGMQGMSQFTKNSFVYFDYPKDSVVRAARGEEWDYNVANNGDYTSQANGLAINFNTNGHRLADGSWGLTIGGTGVPSMLNIGNDAEATAIKSGSIYVGAYGLGDANSNAVDYRRLMSYDRISTAPNSASGQSSGGHTIAQYLAARRMTDNSDGSHINPGDIAMELGFAEDIVQPQDRDNRAGGNFSYGADLGKIVNWNGDWYICSASNKFSATSQACNLQIKSGSITSHVDVNIDTGHSLYLTDATGSHSGYMFSSADGFHISTDLTVNSLKSTNQISALNGIAIRGTQYIQTNDGTNQIAVNANSAGMTFSSATSATTSTIFQTNLVAASSLVIPYGTPSSSTAPCTQGQIEMDADYIYSCVAANSWHRVSNSASW